MLSDLPKARDSKNWVKTWAQAAWLLNLSAYENMCVRVRFPFKHIWKRIQCLLFDFTSIIP